MLKVQCVWNRKGRSGDSCLCLVMSGSSTGATWWLGWLGSCGPELPGALFTDVSGGCVVSLLGHQLGLVATASPRHLGFLRVWGSGRLDSFLTVQGSEGECPKRTVWKLYDCFWLTFRSHVASLLHPVGYKWVTKDAADSVEEGIDPTSWWEGCQRVCGPALKRTVRSLAIE